MTKSMRLALGSAFALTLLFAAPVRAIAQEDVGTRNIPSLEYEQADVREALRALFRTVGVSYSIAPEVQGAITVNLKNVTFAVALENILKQVDATYRVESGVYQILRREIQDAPITPGQDQLPAGTNLVTRRLKIRSADPQFVMLLISAQGGNQSFSLYPELSTVFNTPQGNTGGGGGGGFGGGGGGFGGGGGGFGGGGGGFGGGGGGLGGGGFGGGGRGGGGRGGGGGGGGRGG